MIDPIISFAFSIHSNKGVYALLLGSGVSRSAGIPTGWEITLDLIDKLARLQGEDCSNDPEHWYIEKFGEEPDYAKLLQGISKKPAERKELLRSYFEPTEEERKQGLKSPTAAHKSIAKLVAHGFIRVILTTNFDRLMENALEEIGITPTVISTPDSAKGAMPLAHSQCTIIKVNGDYLDARIKNTPEELAKIDRPIAKILDQVFDEYGLIVCGWSAEWDTALRKAIDRCSNLRFTTFWTTMGKLTESAIAIVVRRKAEMITINGADSFFVELTDRIIALEDLSKPHPLSIQVAIARVKRYVVDDKQRIQLHDMIMQETENLYQNLTIDNFPTVNIPVSPTELAQRISKYEAFCEMLISMFITGCYWGNKDHHSIWIYCIERILHSEGIREGYSVWLNLRRYPTLLLLYAGGIASIATNNYGTLASILIGAKCLDHNQFNPIIYHLYPEEVISRDVARELPGLAIRHTPVSDHLFDLFRGFFLHYLPDEIKYERCFDKFEYFYGLVHSDIRQKRYDEHWGPVGSFGWRTRTYYTDGSLAKEIEAEANEKDDSWGALEAGFFDRSLERFWIVKSGYDEHVSRIRLAWHM